MNENIKRFLESSAFGVAGASSNRSKYGNKVLRCYMQHQLTVYPINPNEIEVEGLKCFASPLDLPVEVNSLSIITPPHITDLIVEQAIEKGIKNIWMQPGAESDKAIELCKQHNINVIAHGPCILVELGFHG